MHSDLHGLAIWTGFYENYIISDFRRYITNFLLNERPLAVCAKQGLKYNGCASGGRLATTVSTDLWKHAPKVRISDTSVKLRRI